MPNNPFDVPIVEPISALDSFRPLINRQQGRFVRSNPKPVRVKSEENKARVRGMKCANPLCRHKTQTFKYHEIDPHHIKTRGSGGGDERENMVPLCRFCHRMAHAGQWTKETLLEWSRLAWQGVPK